MAVIVGELSAFGQPAGSTPSPVQVFPRQIMLVGRDATQQVVVSVVREGRNVDRTSAARWSVQDPQVAKVAQPGRLVSLADGRTTLSIEVDEGRVDIPVEVRQSRQPLPVRFELDVIPILTRLGCNAGACHGKSRGQNGFQLSLLGFYSDFDYAALTLEGRGRRLFPASPEASLLLQKGAGIVPHGGGRRMDPEGPYFEQLRQWIAQGMVRRGTGDPVLQGVPVEPAELILGNNATHALVVTARYSDGTLRDVTPLSAFQSNEVPIAAVDPSGVIHSGPLPGETTVMVRFMGTIVTSRVMIPLPGTVPAETYAQLPRQNFIDDLVWQKLQRLGLTPSPATDDATFLRRAYLDVIGRLPAPDEVRAFLADTAPDKRARLIDALLARPEYGDFWANKWVDLLRPNPYRVGIKAVFNYDHWIRQAFRQNMPYDQFVRQLVTAQGSTWQNGAVTLYRDRRTPDEITTIVSQLFLGIRLECAKCHHHPFENYGQEDFYGFAAYFAKIGRKGTGISPPISGSEEIFFATEKGSVSHPLTNVELAPKPLFGTAPPVDPQQDPREALAAWMTAPDNHAFAQVMANRVWAELMGRGLVEPVDDLRATNPPTNEPLLQALAEHFRKSGFNIKELIRTIATSYVYGLDSRAGERNLTDTRNYSRHYRQRLRAEVLLDAIGDITQVPEKFSAVPPGSRSMEVWTHRVGSIFLDSFGRPDANQDPPCERTPESSIVQALHLMNSPELHKKVQSPEGRAAKLASSDLPPDKIVEELYLLTYGRFPTDAERQFGVSLFSSAERPARQQATEDLLWALLNTPEFLVEN